MAVSREAVVARLRHAQPILKAEFPLRRMALFGSVARGEQSTSSDIDILVDVDPSIGLGFVSLADRLEEILGQRVDLVSSRAVSPAMRRSVDSDLIEI